MKIQAENIGKRFQNEWIFRKLSASFERGECVAINGSNGSGKSTLIQLLSGYLSPSEGRINWEKDGKSTAIESLYREVAMSAPYMSLYDHFTLKENILFFSRFKSFRNGADPAGISQIMELKKSEDKQLRYFSSGMRQRAKLALAILADTPLLFLDEPCSHLDARATKWYQELLLSNIEQRLVFIASNDQQNETFLCTGRIIMEQLK
ncbi:MAG: ABC transporter ATP-binding protein [Crocinitomicaceae bacterium]|nr:ABC transporter ATP-binding protein [Crocinitomicaceae bacterium]